MAKNTSSSTNQQTTTLDPAARAALDDYTKRNASTSAAGRAATNAMGFASQNGMNGIEGYMNPYIDEMIGGAKSDFAYQRGQAGMDADDEATRAGAFGGDRAAVLKGVRQGGIDRNEASALSAIRGGGYDMASRNMMADRDRGLQTWQAQNQAQGYGLGFGGQTVTGKQTQTPSFWDRYFQWAQANASVAGSAATGGMD